MAKKPVYKPRPSKPNVRTPGTKDKGVKISTRKTSRSRDV